MLGYGDLLTEAQAMGSIWKFPERDFYPRIDRKAIQDLADVDKLAPVDPMSDQFWSVPLNDGGLLQESIGGEVAAVGSTLSPFFVATELRGNWNLMMDTITSTEVVKRVIKVALESLKTYGERLNTLRIEHVFVDDSSATGSLVSPEMCSSLDTRFVREQVQNYRSLELRTILHIDAQLPYLDMQIEIAPACLHFNNYFVDLPAVLVKHRGKSAMMSGINYQELLFRRSPQEAEEAVVKVLDLYSGGLGLIIAPGCEVPFKSPLENLYS
jgi:uroporphyrinogen decarboxylase